MILECGHQVMKMSGISGRLWANFFLIANVLWVVPGHADKESTSDYFEQIKGKDVFLRDFLTAFPKGGELHTHFDGAVYAESYLEWAAADGKCIDLASDTITLPPCDTADSRPPVAQIKDNAMVVNRLIDALSIRNYEWGKLSGHDQFFVTFPRFSAALPGRAGDGLAEISDRAAMQNNHYLELIFVTGMDRAINWGASVASELDTDSLDEWVNSDELQAIYEQVVAETSQMESQWRDMAQCDTDSPSPGCNVTVRHISAVIRVLPREMVLAQTVLAFMLVENDPRYVGLNFVAPEDHPIALRDYDWHMELLAALSENFPNAAKHITLHAGELALGLVPTAALLSNMDKAINVAGASRIGHGTSIVHEQTSHDLLKQMAEEEILVEINLTSNAVILGVSGQNHPFELYRKYGVPLALSTDDEGVARIDITHEFQRAVQTYDLSYDDIKELSRNALAYSYLPGENLFRDMKSFDTNKTCRRDVPGESLSSGCDEFLNTNEKARLQWQLEGRFRQFEAGF
jgi:adenosine deaminase